jgi:hypothetical protein
MNVRPTANVSVRDAGLPWGDSSPGTESDRTAVVEAPHAGLLEGATVTGEAAREQLSVRIGLWLDDSGWVRQARWRAVKDVDLRAHAEAACALLESRADPACIDAHAVELAVHGALRGESECAELVASAVRAAVLLRVT